MQVLPTVILYHSGRHSYNDPPGCWASRSSQSWEKAPYLQNNVYHIKSLWIMAEPRVFGTQAGARVFVR